MIFAVFLIQESLLYESSIIRTYFTLSKLIFYKNGLFHQESALLPMSTIIGHGSVPLQSADLVGLPYHLGIIHKLR